MFNNAGGLFNVAGALTGNASGAPAAALAQEVAATVQSVTKLRADVKLVAPGSLPNDGKVIADERTNP